MLTLAGNVSICFASVPERKLRVGLMSYKLGIEVILMGSIPDYRLLDALLAVSAFVIFTLF